MMTPPWVKELIGIPFVDRGRSRRGGDCWNVVQLGLKAGWGIEVPDYTEHYETTIDREEIARLVARESLGWIPVPLAQAQLGDVLFLRILGNECHAGLIVDPPWFLHAIRGACSCLERWDAAIWERRISAVYRHPQLVRTEVPA
jgi:cell wall-associated NlpC family hydrolase